MAFSVSFPQAPENVRLDRDYLRQLTSVVNNIMRGKTNNRGEVTLTASATSTTVTDVNAGGESLIIFMPTTANAASEIYGGTMYVSSQSKEEFVITHANNSQTDRDFRYIVIG